jgi:putative SOS response-associated peptidase YedK
VEGEHRLYGFLTTEPNAVVKSVHSTAMPVILTGEACDVWLRAPMLNQPRVRTQVAAASFILPMV